MCIKITHSFFFVSEHHICGVGVKHSGIVAGWKDFLRRGKTWGDKIFQEYHPAQYLMKLFLGETDFKTF